MSSKQPMKNPRRVAAGKRNRALRGPITEEGSRALRIAIGKIKPWENATGPKTPEGKQVASMNRCKTGKPKSANSDCSCLLKSMMLRNLNKYRSDLSRVRTVLSAYSESRDSPGMEKLQSSLDSLSEQLDKSSADAFASLRNLSE